MSTEVLTSVPGNIWKVLVEVGDEVSEGDVLFIMEVMKSEVNHNAPISGMAKSRLSIMRETNDGFRIAGEDLRLRGPGEVLGKRQSGDPEFMLADLSYHEDLLALAHDEAKTTIENDTILDQDNHDPQRLLMALFERDQAVTYLAGG